MRFVAYPDLTSPRLHAAIDDIALTIDPVWLSSRFIYRFSVCQQTCILSLVALFRCDITDATMPMRFVYQRLKRSTHRLVSSSPVKPADSQPGTYFNVLNNDSTNGLSLLTRGRLCEPVIFSSSSFAFNVWDFIGPPLMPF